MHELGAVTVIDVLDTVESVIVTFLALIAAVGTVWVLIGRPIHRALFSEKENDKGQKVGLFPGIFQRLDTLQVQFGDLTRERVETKTIIEDGFKEIREVQSQHSARVEKHEKSIGFLKERTAGLEAKVFNRPPILEDEAE